MEYFMRLCVIGVNLPLVNRKHLDISSAYAILEELLLHSALVFSCKSFLYGAFIV